jgi:hypothetical protein
VGGSKGSVLYAGQSYYHTWYLSRELRKLGWRADVLNWDSNPANDLYYHGEDYRFRPGRRGEALRQFGFYLSSLLDYDVFHFSNANGISFGQPLEGVAGRLFGDHSEIQLLKRLGKKIVYTHTGCLDGVSKTSFAAWREPPVCFDCAWRDVPSICSDEKNLAWGRFRNSVADFQVTAGGNRADYNDDPRVHEVPEFGCLDPDVWNPQLEIPPELRLPEAPGRVRVFHAVGNMESRTDPETGRNIKSTHIWLPMIERLRSEGHDVELLSPHNVPNKELRFIQAQADVFVDMLTYGYYGATAREGMMLGKPVLCHLRPIWLDQMREQIPDYVDGIPIVDCNPASAYDTLVDLVTNPGKRDEIGRRSREFAVRWHSARAAASRFDQIYTELIENA